MKLLSYASVLCVLVLACSVPAYVEQSEGVNLSAYKTYSWVETRASENDASARATAYADINVHNAVNRELQRWGWVETQDNPSALVTYDILVERDVEQRQEAVYTQPFTRYYYNYRSRRYVPIYYPSQFAGYDSYTVPVRNATITVTIIDPDKDQRIWQGWTTEQVSGSRLTGDEVSRSIRRIFRKS